MTVGFFLIPGCYSDPCKHGATCTDTDLSPHYKCACAEGYSGSHCNKVTGEFWPCKSIITVYINH